MSEGNIDQAGRRLMSKNSSDDFHPADRDGCNAKNADEASGDETISVQDLVDRHSTTTRTPEVGEKSVAKGLIGTGLTRVATLTAQTRNRIETLRQSAISAFTPGDGDKELAKTITASLSSLPTFLKEQVWRSSSSQREERNLDGMPTPTNSDLFPEDSTTTGPVSGLENGAGAVASSTTGARSLQQVEHQKVESIAEDSRTTAHVSGLENRAAGVASSATGARSLQQVENQNVESKAGEGRLDPIGPEKLMKLQPMDSENYLPAQSEKTPGSTSSAGAINHTNVKAEAIADAKRSRVITDADAYVAAELRKAEAHAQKMLAKADSQRVQEEAKAMEILRKEELRAELLVHNAEVKAEKLLAEAKSKAASIGAPAEEYARAMADAKTKAERWLAEIEETKQREIAELYDRVEQMILMREFPLPSPEHKKGSVVKKVKEKVLTHIRGY